MFAIKTPPALGGIFKLTVGAIGLKREGLCSMTQSRHPSEGALGRTNYLVIILWRNGWENKNATKVWWLIHMVVGAIGLEPTTSRM